jgi:diguanylate cyclase (GGDEF)-like protein
VEESPSFAPREHDVLRHAIDDVLSRTWRLAPLVSLELMTAQAPAASAPPGESSDASLLVACSATVPDSDWSFGGRVKAMARPEDAHRVQVAVDFAAAMIGHLASAAHRRDQTEALARRALAVAGTDPLTELGNLRTWRHRLAEEQERAARRSEVTTVLVLDLDGLKQVNDRSGHRAGDVLLTRVGSLLRSSCRSVDTPCRLGGDEFGVIAPDTPKADALLNRLCRLFDEAQIAASIGAAQAGPGTSLDQAWQQADRRMYANKRTGARCR